MEEAEQVRGGALQEPGDDEDHDDAAGLAEGRLGPGIQVEEPEQLSHRSYRASVSRCSGGALPSFAWPG